MLVSRAVAWRIMKRGAPVLCPTSDDTAKRHTASVTATQAAESERDIADNRIEPSTTSAKQLPVSSNQYGGDEALALMSLFKTAFKKYKKRAPPPDLSKVIDARTMPIVSGTNADRSISTTTVTRRPLRIAAREELGRWADAGEVRRLGLRPLDEWTVSTIAEREGLYILPDLLREEAHETWMERVFRYADPPNTTNMTAHGNQPDTDALRQAGRNLRWTTLGVEYDWVSKEYPLTGRPLPDELVGVADLVSRALGLGTMHADAAIVNYYPPKSTLSPHVDRSERTSAPLVSLSLGQSAVYLTGGVSLDDEVIPLWLRAGDVLVMHADQRLVYHAVPSIHRTRDFKFADAALSEYASTSRVNITIRQVNEI